jgi:FMN hydrolase / 5-amino-6-(5-phospho-D-ribitylamino)uracil phosphatase
VKRKPDFVLFDVMDTIVFDPAYTTLPALFDLPIKELWAAANPTAWPAFEKGHLSEDEYFQRFFTDGRRVDGAALKVGLEQNYRWLDGMEELLGDLQREQVNMHILSNYPIWFELIERKLKLSRYLPWTFVSHKTGLRKPDPASYISAAQSLGFEPHRGLFIDDREKNCQAARAHGMDAILFENAIELRAQLSQRKLI